MRSDSRPDVSLAGRIFSVRQYARTSSLGAALVLALCGGLCAARGENAPAPQQVRAGPYFLGYETEPAMDYGGRTLSSLDLAISDLGSRLVRRKPALAAAYEWPFAYLLSTAQHEVFGHGGRGREFGLNPSFGVGSDLGAYTSIEKDPESNEQLILLSGAGTEGDGILADRIARGLCARDSTPASLIPLMFVARLDLTLYAYSTSKPEESSDDNSFNEQFKDGNDIANYLVGRQAQRKGATASEVWNRDGYSIDFTDERLRSDWDDVRMTALWNMADPMLWASMFVYARDHLLHGQRYAAPPALPVGEHLLVSVGTRAALDPQSVTRFLDLYLLTGWAGFRIYGRDLHSSDDTSFGGGGEVFGLRIKDRLRLRAGADAWANPETAEALYHGNSWNVQGEIEAALTRSLWLSVKTGRKSDGFLPGTPANAGQYFGGGLSYLF
jgi:hypothetical protein